MNMKWNLVILLTILVSKIDSMLSHHYAKENLKRNEALVILDFAENYSFVVQDAVQGFHWNNSHATPTSICGLLLSS